MDWFCFKCGACFDSVGALRVHVCSKSGSVPRVFCSCCGKRKIIYVDDVCRCCYYKRLNEGFVYEKE